MTDYREQVALALRAVAVPSPTSYTWFGRRSRPLPALLRSALDADAARAYLVQELQGVLYRSFYSQGAPVPITGHEPMPAPPDPQFVAALSRSNSGRGGWERGWQVERVDSEGVDVVRDGLLVRAGIGHCRARRDAPTPGEVVSLRRPKDYRSASPGFYTALGDAELSTADDDTEVRVYFHLTAAGAAPLVETCTRVLNSAGVPFVLKVVDNPARFLRCDAAVLYLGDGDFRRAVEHLRTIVAECAAFLRAEVPAFTKPLADGIAVGEHDDALGGSFGMSRCQLVAEAIVDAQERRASNLDTRLDAVASRFANRGLNLELPYLAAGSVDRYVL